MSTPQRILVIGGGAAGFFAAITSAEKADTQVFLYEAT
ncbi:MAG: NAD(P)/FAD-dependent oxidoreductase, partial [Opitutae bacterium]